VIFAFLRDQDTNKQTIL